MTQNPIQPRKHSFFARKYTPIFMAIALTGACTGSAWAQGEAPSGTVSGSGSGSLFTYSLIFSDASSATSPIGSVWYGWIPGQFFLPGGTITTPSGTLPNGWTESVVANSIQFVASSPIYDIQPGSSLPGFSYTASFSPATLAGTANSGLSVAYSGGIEASPDFSGHTFTVSAVVPEPTSIALFGMSALGLAIVRRRGLRLTE